MRSWTPTSPSVRGRRNCSSRSLRDADSHAWPSRAHSAGTIEGYYAAPTTKGQNMKHAVTYTASIIGLAIGFAGSVLAQTTANGPYYATPSWDQTLPVST